MGMGGYSYIASVMPGGSPLVGRTYPHCDFRVLHSQGACVYCDGHPDWQAERMSAGVLFTDDPRNAALVELLLELGVTHVDGVRPCPAQVARGASCETWSGNKPRPQPVN
jgi:hypothetical protein